MNGFNRPEFVRKRQQRPLRWEGQLSQGVRSGEWREPPWSQDILRVRRAVQMHHRQSVQQWPGQSFLSEVLL